VLSAEMIDTGDCYATFKLLIPLLANMTMIGLIWPGGKQNADGEAYFRPFPTTIFCGTVIFRGLGGRSGECGMRNGEKGCHRLFRIPHSAFPIPHSPELLMKPLAEPFYPCPGAGPYCGALIVPGLCGGAMNPYNGVLNFVASY
jgi:hypothetical protein